MLCFNALGDLRAAIASSERRRLHGSGTNDISRLLGVPVERDSSSTWIDVVEALAPLVDVVVAAATAMHFAGGLSPPSVNAG